MALSCLFIGVLYGGVSGRASAQINPAGPASVNVGGIAVGLRTKPYMVKFDVEAGTTIGSIDTLTSGAVDKDFFAAAETTCKPGIYHAKSTCEVGVVFKPSAPGLRNGAVVIYDKAGDPLTTIFVHGTGVGSQTVYNTQKWYPLKGEGEFLVGHDMVIDGDGNLFFTDVYRDSVVEAKRTKDGFGPAVVVVKNLNYYIFGIAIDGAGNLYIADFGKQVVYRAPRTTQGFGPVMELKTNLDQPYGVAVDAEGSVYVADAYKGQVFKLPWIGSRFGSQVIVTGGLALPYEVAVDGTGNVYIANHGNGWSATTGFIYEVRWDGRKYGPLERLGSGWFAPTGVAVDGQGNLYVTDAGGDSGTVWVLPWNGREFGKQELLWTAWGPYPEGIAVDSRDNVYLANIDTGSGIELVRDSPDPPGAFDAPVQ